MDILTAEETRLFTCVFSDGSAIGAGASEVTGRLLDALSRPLLSGRGMAAGSGAGVSAAGGASGAASTAAAGASSAATGACSASTGCSSSAIGTERRAIVVQSATCHVSVDASGASAARQLRSRRRQRDSIITRCACSALAWIISGRWRETGHRHARRALLRAPIAPQRRSARQAAHTWAAAAQAPPKCAVAALARAIAFKQVAVAS